MKRDEDLTHGLVTKKTFHTYVNTEITEIINIKTITYLYHIVSYSIVRLSFFMKFLTKYDASYWCDASPWS